MSAAMHVPRDTHMAEMISDMSGQSKMGRTYFNILDKFNQLKDSNPSVRLNGGVALLNYIHQHNTDQNDKELDLALVKMVTRLGSSLTSTRTGFYSTLTVFLMTHPDTSVEKLLSIMNTQLRPAGSNLKSENADIYMGHILLCGALIRSKLLARNSVEIQQQIMEILLNAGKKRSYLSFISTMFLSEFIIQLDIKSIKDVWPIVEKEIGKPWSEQTLDTFYMLLILRDKHPSLVNHKFLKQHLGMTEIITKESVEDIVRLLTALLRIVSYQHPVFKLFCEKLVATEFVADFWKGIDQKFIKPSKSDEYIAVEMLRLILLNVTDKTVIPSLLSPNFLQHMLKRFSICKKNRNDEVLMAFRKVLHLVVSATNGEDIKTKTQLSILKKLILDPGDLMIEKKTGVKVIQIIMGNLRIDGIKKLSQLYREITESKTEFRTNAERSYTAQLLTKLMGRPETFLDQDWRLEQLVFLFNYGLCEVSDVGIELAQQFKDSFYRALDYKLPKLDNARNLLSALVHNLDSKLQSNMIRLRSPLNDAAADAWKRVTDLIEKLEKNTKHSEALPIFHTMNLHMGLQLFSDPEIAIMSINELQCCYERLSKKSKKHKKLNNTVTEEEPEWVEVVVDLLLSLLSKNDHLFRSLVGCVFPHICPYLTPSAVYQILAVLDIKNTQKTLTTKQNDDSSGIESESDNEEDEEEESVSNDEVLSKSESESDSSENEDEDEDETMTDKLRIALHQALGDAAMKTDDEDIDVDEIDEEEGKRLDKSLAAAFKTFRENQQARSKKQGKTSQTLMHFRARVIDLLQIYLETSPSMAITLDMIVPLFALLEFCIKDPHQEPLAYRIRACLKKLSTVKKFKDTTNVDETLLTTVLKALIEKGERSASVCQELNDKLAECCTFLVRCAQQANLSTESIVEIYGKNLTAFFKQRDCVLSHTLFKGVLQLCWEDNWQLALLLVDFAFDSSIRYFRRNQALELLLIFYNNNRLLNMNTKYADMRMKLETTLYKNTINTFKETSNLRVSDGQSTLCNNVSTQKNVLQKFIGHLLMLLRLVHARCLTKAWDWQTVKMALINYRSQYNLSGDTKIAYNKLAADIGVPLNLPSKKDNAKLNSSNDIVSQSNGKQSIIGSQNGKTSDLEEEKEEEEQEEVVHNNNEQKKRRKNKSKQREKQLLKKEARELRAKVMSQDIEPFNFSSVSLPENEDTTEFIQNGNLHDQSTNSKAPQKRNQTMEDDRESKRRKRINPV
ncbi:Myb-binding protein 1A [Trachymyrmex septentrionalis]|uniref:Myb-binding protein 1A n=1 Tax=Trachymyrmex septentrionalis TaxID=34720 RepID=A0A195FKT7_9HYME|nr:PREDICTED: myb-binding protein 1A [Trachymyrmex septentrionalis]KYN40609.1 Myb-binding protein 1A [Trachymyrmex septentrionalis]